MIYKTTGIISTIMQAVEGTGTPEQDFNYIMNYKPQVYSRNDIHNSDKSDSDSITAAKNNGEYFIAGEMKQANGMYSRNNASLESRSLIVLDIDETALSIDELYVLLKEKLKDISFILYPTASHSDRATRARLVILPERPIKRYEYLPITENLAVVIGINIDKASSTWSQHMGLPLEYEGMKDIFKINKNLGKPYPITTPANTHKKADSKGRIIAEGNRNNELFRIGISLQKSGIDDEKIQETLLEENLTLCIPPLDENEVNSIYRSVIGYPKGQSSIFKEGNVIVKEGKYCRLNYTKHGEQYLPISNFIMIPLSITEYIDTKADDYVEVDIILENGGKVRKLLNASSFNDVQGFKNAIGTFKTSYTGTKEDLQCIKVMVNKGSDIVIRAYSCGGIHKIDGIWSFVSTEGTINNNNELSKYIVHSNNDGLRTYIENVQPLTREDLLSIGEHLLKFNSTPIALGILLYLSSIFLKEKLYQEMGIKFPHLIIAGEAGAGKSATVKNIISKVLCISGAEHSASGITKFTADKYLSSNNTIPYIIEEYKPDYLRSQSMQDISNLTRSAHDRQISSRGRKDGTIDKYPLLAPIIIVGESSFSETAVVERSIMLTFSKKDSRVNFNSFNEIQGREELGRLGRSLLNASLNIAESELIDYYREYMNKVNGSEKLKVDRLKNHVSVMMLGYEVLKKVFENLDMDLEGIYGIKSDMAMDILSDLIISENLNNNANSKTAIDITLELMADAYYNYYGPSASSVLQVINRDGRRLLGIKLKKLHPVMSKYVRDFNISSKYLTIEDLKKQISRAPYFVSIDGSDTYKINYNGTSGMFTLLDAELLKEAGIEFDFSSRD